MSYKIKRHIMEERFVKKASAKHGDGKYNYSDVYYVNSYVKVNIKCMKCNNFFMQRPVVHLNGSGCPTCAMQLAGEAKASNVEEFIRKSKVIHGNKYNYSRTIYDRSYKKVKIFCKQCGNVFLQTPAKHLTGQGCRPCSYRKCADQKRDSNEDFISKAKATHGFKYDYSDVNYQGRHNNLKIICKKHGVFIQLASVHLSGGGCPECAIIKGGASRRLTTKEFIERSDQKHRGFYDYSLVEYKGAYASVKIICPEHGEFNQRPLEHLYDGCGCQICGRKKRLGVYHETYFNDNPQIKDLSAIFYFIRLTNTASNEIFYKVGITRNNVNKRFKKYKKYNIETIKAINTTLYKAFIMEQRTLKRYNKYKYTPQDKKFDGYTECFNYNIFSLKEV